MGGMMEDRYASFAELSNGERAGIDYRVRCVDRNVPIVIIAPHGGWIEHGTSDISEETALDQWSFYAFEGLRKGRPHRDLHITSTRFDEENGVSLISSAETAIAIHGRHDDDDPKSIGLGGLNVELGSLIAESLRSEGFHVTAAGAGLSGQHPMNICNRGTTGRGVQLELPSSLRRKLRRDPARLKVFSAAVREALSGVFSR